VRLLDAEDFAGFGLCESALFEGAVDFERKASLELFLLRVCKTEIGENVAAAPFNAGQILFFS
jgi:hypothetical protein